MSARIGVDIMTKEWTAVAVATGETTPLFSIQKGDIILEVHWIIKTLSGGTTDSTLEVGDGGDPNRFAGQIDPETGSVGDIVAGVTAAFPYTYPADDTIDLVYAVNATPGSIAPEVTVYVSRLKTAHA